MGLRRERGGIVGVEGKWDEQRGMGRGIGVFPFPGFQGWRRRD